MTDKNPSAPMNVLSHLGEMVASQLGKTQKLLMLSLSICVLFGISVYGQLTKPSNATYSQISRYEIELLMADVAKSDPLMVKRLAEDPAMKKDQLESLKKLLAYATQAQREGLESDPINRQELESIRSEVVAVSYDKELNKGKPTLPAFGYITDKQVAAYWNSNSSHETEFDSFLNAKLAIMKAGDPANKDREMTERERTLARDVFAKTRIYDAEYDAKVKTGALPKVFIERTNLQVKLQQAQFLSRLMAEKIAGRFEATDSDIGQYIAQHPELDPKTKRAKAQGILDRAKAGENFAALANEFTEDPGNIGQNGERSGGIYRDIPKGQMVAPFEQAALALNAGEISPGLVETDFGFHIIKLERKGISSDPAKRGMETYDARHILIATTVPDPSNPNARPKPLKVYVRDVIESEREKEYTGRLIAENKIQVPDDFTVPDPATVDEATPATAKPKAKKQPAKKRK